MKIKVIQKCFAGTGENLMAGEEYEVMDRIGQKLIDRGYAEPADKPKPPKKSNRSVGLKTSDEELEKPESDD
tara:strand:- start:1982 stop:2197 length:216 start_codon:yes stop_codon:yes gene_type:complete